MTRPSGEPNAVQTGQPAVSVPTEALAAVGTGVLVLERREAEFLVVAANTAFLASLPLEQRASLAPATPLRACLPSPAVDAVERLAAMARHGEEPTQRLERVEFPGEQARWYRWAVVPDAVNGRVCVLSVDATEAMRLRERAAVQDAERAAITDGLRDAVILMTADRTIRYANDAAERLLDGPLLGDNWMAVRARIGFQRSDRIPRAITVERALAGFDPDPVDVEFSVRGHAVICRASVQPLRLDGDVIGAAVVLSDITDERRLAQERKSLLARELAVNEQVRNEVAAALHDGVLQTLAELSVLVGSIAASGRDLDPALVLDAVERGVKQCRQITEDLRPGQIDQGVSAALRALAESWRSQGLLDVSTEGAVLRRLEPWRETLLYQVAAEALRNALKHARGSHVRLVQEEHSDRLVVVIADDGPGATSQQRRAAADAGHLGLVLSRERMDAAGGTYEFDSQPGAGTTVTLTVPVP